MTREEAIKFLSNTKVHVNGKSKEVQEKLFSLGFQWKDGSKQVLYERKSFLYLYGNMKICYGDSMEYFTKRTLREIAVADILSIVIDEPKYRPFKDAEECWQEMLKHQPFGWLVNLKYKYRVASRHVADNAITLSNGPSHKFSEVFEEYTFVDGTPFGIK